MVRVLVVRVGWVAVVGALFFGRDMCLGGSKRPAPPPEPDKRDSSLDVGASAPARVALADQVQPTRRVTHG
ncbi:MAG TPA: hypothetical protein PLR99_15095 [Polyangiaceae bacterium]|jgi:hypothetical protein|nr:hypothetical protein [Polyangiaceae bacterium]